MNNWAGNIKWNPKGYFLPNNKNEIISIIQQAKNKKLPIRVIGSGHSFSPLCATNGYSISLNNLQHIQQDETNDKLVYIQGGAKLYQISYALNTLGLAQENMGDIDRQSIAGATATGTHGTGIAFGNISTQIEEITFINGLGEVITANESNSTLFNSARVSLGSLGVVTDVRLKTVPAYLLKQEKKKERFSDVVKNIDAITDNNRQFEFHWLLHTDIVQSKYINITNEKPQKVNRITRWLDEVLFENYLFELLNIISKIFPSTCAFLNRLASKFISNSININISNKIFATTRTVRFYESEYNIPYEHYPAVVNEMLQKFEEKKYKIFFPQEHRFVKGDDIFLSPAYKRKSAYIAIHAYKGTNYEAYFNDMQAIFKRYGGRPHWGKMHNCDAAYLATVYPEWNTFLTVRKQQDPNGIFLNEHLRKIFNIAE